MNIIQSVANDIDSHIKVTYGILSNDEEGKVPILDVKDRMTDNNTIEYEFYRKPMANRLVTHKTSAMSMQQKIHILTQQCFSRLHNTSENIPEGRKISHLDEFMRDLKMSGYSENDRMNILQSAICTHLKLKYKAKEGIRPYYRPKHSVHSVNKKQKSSKNRWYRKHDDRFKTVMFVEATPNDELLKMLKLTEEKNMIYPKL